MVNVYISINILSRGLGVWLDGPRKIYKCGSYEVGTYGVGCWDDGINEASRSLGYYTHKERVMIEAPSKLGGW